MTRDDEINQQFVVDVIEDEVVDFFIGDAEIIEIASNVTVTMNRTINNNEI